MVRGPKQHTDEWHAAKRVLITSTDIAAILGLSPWASEGDVARHKMGAPEPEVDDAQARRMRLGLAMEDIVASEDEVEHGFKLRHVRRMIISDAIPWAGTSLDFERIGQKVIVEIKTTSARDWGEGLPERVEAQVRWQMGVAGYPAAHIAVLRYGNQLECHDLQHDEEVFQNLVIIAEDFRTRLAAGGPFIETRESMRRAFRRDDGTEVVATEEEANAVGILLDVRRRKAELAEKDDQICLALQKRMATAAVMVGTGFRITWKQSKPTRKVEWKLIADGLLSQLSDEERATLIELQTTEREGSRPFIVKETNE
jgi:putative phage-type endonuclease